MDDCETSFSKTRRGTKEGCQELQGHCVDIGDVLVLFCVWRRKNELVSWKKLHVGGVDGISCQHLQAMRTHL